MAVNVATGTTTTLGSQFSVPTWSIPVAKTATLPTALTPTVGSAQTITSFILVDADSNQDIRPLTDGDTIDQRNITIRANTTPALVGSVVFGLNDNARFRVEDDDNYSLAGDRDGDYLVWPAEPGKYTLTATPYSEDDGGGTAGTPLTITFTVVDAK
jgi:hypothetical protein